MMFDDALHPVDQGSWVKVTAPPGPASHATRSSFKLVRIP